mmetsp:Transcript_23252/g.32730  ORF Transcript_23252/g.32730 Transcript_23252/m.32730 type:complete len:337 (+) Transcript_23252:187-1197(+)
MTNGKEDSNDILRTTTGTSRNGVNLDNHNRIATSMKEKEVPFRISLLAGGMAGTSVDVALFPIDTVKTRLQSPQGFWKAGGFRGIYNGLAPAALGSAPSAALFFGVYEYLKPRIITIQNGSSILPHDPSLSHMMAASAGETVACLIRVPTEVLKQNMQLQAAQSSSKLNASSSSIPPTQNSLSSTLKVVLGQKNKSSPFGGLYRGFGITLMREIPFALVQFPLFEKFKTHLAKYKRIPRENIPPHQAALCGSISGGIAAAITTPLDVIKTRLMLGKDIKGIPYKNAMDVLHKILHIEGTHVLWSGIQPRVMWISIGGFVFFGAFETFCSHITPFMS